MPDGAEVAAGALAAVMRGWQSGKKRRRRNEREDANDRRLQGRYDMDQESHTASMEEKRHRLRVTKMEVEAAEQAKAAWRAPWNADVGSSITWNYHKWLLDAEGKLVRGGFMVSGQSPVEAEPLIREMLGLEPLSAEDAVS